MLCKKPLGSSIEPEAAHEPFPSTSHKAFPSAGTANTRSETDVDLVISGTVGSPPAPGRAEAAYKMIQCHAYNDDVQLEQPQRAERPCPQGTYQSHWLHERFTAGEPREQQ